MKVIANTTGFDGKQVRVAGDAFDMPDGSKARWFDTAPDGESAEPVAEAEPDAPKPSKAKHKADAPSA